jgi:hypothetical protein
MANKADVVIKIEVKDGEAKRKLDAMEARLKALQGAGGGASSSIDDVTNSTNKMNSAVKNSSDEFDKHTRKTKDSHSAMMGLHGAGSRLKALFGNIGKMAKFAGIEFGAMTVVLAGLKAALIVGEYSMKAFRAGLTGLAAGAGLAIGALAGVLGAVRQVNNAKMAPYALGAKQSLTGSSAMSNKTSAVMGDQQLGMFKDATLNSAMTSAYKNGQQVDSAFKGMLSTLGNFAIASGDPDKALGSLSEAFMQARKAGSFTEDSIKAITDASPELGKAVKESGMGVNEFMSALSAGNIKGLENFNGALDRVNDTVLGRFKGALRVLKEDLTTLGGPIANLAKGPIPVLQKQLHSLLYTIGPSVQSAYATLFPKLAASGEGAMGTMFEKLGVAINRSLPKLESFGANFGSVIGTIKDFFSSIYDWMTKMTTGWNTLFNNILKPIGVEVWKTIETAIQGFNDTILGTGNTSAKFGDQLHGIFEGIRGLITGFNNVRTAIAPITDTLLQLLSLLGKLASNKAMGTLLAGAGMMAFMSRGKSNLLKFAMGGGSGAYSGQFQAAKDKVLNKQLASGNTIGQTYGIARGIQAGPLPGGVNGTMTTTKALAYTGREMGKTAGVKIASTLKAATPAIGTMVAGVAGSMILSNAEQTSIAGQGIGNALTMGATGAAIGSMIAPGIGTAIGGALGGVVGGITGVVGALNAQKKEMQQTVQNATDFATKGFNVNQLYGRGGIIAQRNKIQAEINGQSQLPNITEKRTAAGKQLTVSGVNDTSLGLLSRSISDSYTTVNGARTKTDMTSMLEDLQAGLKVVTGAGAGGKAEDRINANNKLIADLESAYGAVIDPTIKKAITDFNTLDSQYDDLYKKFGSKSLEAWNKSVDKLKDEYGKLGEKQDRLKNNYKTLANVLGMSGEQATKFGDSIDKNLGEKLITIDDVIQGLGFTLDEFGKVLDDTANRALGSSRAVDRMSSEYKKKLAEMETQTTLNTAGTTYFNLAQGTSGPETEKAGYAFATAMIEREKALYSSGAKTGVTYKGNIEDTIKTLTDQLAYMRNTPGFNQDTATQFDTIINGPDGLIAKLQLGLTNFGIRLQEDPQLSGGIKGVISAGVEGFLKDPNFTNANAEQQTAAVDSKVNEIIAALGVYFPDVKINPEDKNSIKALVLGGLQESGLDIKMIEAVKSGVEQGSDYLVQKLATTPLYFYKLAGDKNEEDIPKDTSSPRAGRVGDTTSSRWAATLGKHMAFDQMAGKRTITSGVRNYNLGSPSSDHTTGAAYDLTGDNLGAYANSVNGAGGFAEFHGAAGSRHLHVVPPMGDSTTPALIGAMASSGGSTNNSYSIVVNGGSDSADVIARKVMDEIQRNNRSNQERA